MAQLLDCLEEIHLKYKHTNKLTNKIKINTSLKDTRAATLISDKQMLEKKNAIRDKDSCFIITKGQLSRGHSNLKCLCT